MSDVWPVLEKGDVVDVIAPGFGVSPEQVAAAREFLLRWGLVPRIPKDLIQKHFLHANSDEKRFQFLQEALEARDSRVIWCLRGGYGSNRLVPRLEQLRKPKQFKLLIGISDITSLHLYWQKKWHWPSLHAPLLDRLGQGKVPPKIEKELHRLLFGKQSEVKFEKLKAMNEAALLLKQVKAPVVGGNLVVLQSSLGTSYQLDTRGKILFIEDLGERGYRVDRILEHFDQVGLFKHCKALILGEFLGGEEPNSQKPLWPRVFKSWAERLPIPVFQGLEAGHGVIQRPVPLLTESELRGGERGSLVVTTKGMSK